MLDLIASHRSELHAHCWRYEVRRIELFGSAVRGDCDPATSNLDVLFAYQPNICHWTDQHGTRALFDQLLAASLPPRRS